MLNGNGQPMLGNSPTQAAAGPVVPEGQRIAAHCAHARAAGEVEPPDGAVMGCATYNVVVAGRAGYVEGPHTVLGKQTHAVQLAAVG